MTELPPPRYRPCVGIMLINSQGLVWIGRRHKGGPENVAASHSWQMPQGGIDEGETPLVAAHRELYEETSVKSVSLLAEAPAWYSYDLPNVVAKKSWRGRYQGQAQRWFAFRFEGDENEIDVLAPPEGHKPEFSEWRWERAENLPGLIIPFKRQVYENVVTAFAHLTA